MKYRKNGALLYTSTIAPTYPLLVDTALHTNGAALTDVIIFTPAQNVIWTNIAGVSVSGNSLTKTATTGWGNAGAVSSQALTSGDGYVEFTVTVANTDRMAGLSNGDSNQNYTDIDFALFPRNDGSLQIYEGGVFRGAFGTYAVGDRLRVAVEGGVVKYRKNGALLYTSTIAPTYPLLVDTALHTNGAALTDVVFGTGGSTDINWLVPDHLGTPRIIIDKTGSLANVKRHDYLPFGEELYATQGLRSTGLGYTGDSVRQKFTSKERDNETNLDYFLARYYSSTQGRFTSPDEFSGGPDELFDFAEDAADNPTFYADLEEPQSLNKYQYCYNNPLAYVDLDGHASTIPKKRRDPIKGEDKLDEWEDKEQKPLWKERDSFPSGLGRRPVRPRRSGGPGRNPNWVIVTNSRGKRQWRYFPGGATWRDLPGRSPVARGWPAGP